MSSAPPNILFILTDNQRADLLGCAGNPIVITPRIDRLAQRGVRFANAFATTPICAASRASYLTGLYERHHRFTFKTPPLATTLHRSQLVGRIQLTSPHSLRPHECSFDLCYQLVRGQRPRLQDLISCRRSR